MNKHRTSLYLVKTFVASILVLMACALIIKLPMHRAAAQQPSVYAIRNAKIVTVTGATIERGTVIIREGKIADVGARVTVPANAKIIDATGLSVYPGMID